MAYEILDSDTIYAHTPFNVFVYAPFVFMVDKQFPTWLRVYKIIDNKLVHLFSESIPTLQNVHFDGVYVTLCGGFGLSIYNFSEAGIILIDTQFDENPPGQSIVYNHVIKVNNIWHCTCALGGVQGYELVGATLVRVAARLRDHWGTVSGICFDDGYLYIGNGLVTESVVVYEFTGSGYDYITAWNGVSLGAVNGVKAFKGTILCNGYQGGTSFLRHIKSPHSLELIASRNTGQTNDVHAVDDVCFEAANSGASILDLIGTNINEIDALSGTAALTVGGNNDYFVIGFSNNLSLYNVLTGAELLRNLLVQKRYNQWEFVKMLKALFPRGPAWRFNIYEEKYVQVQSIVSSERWGITTVTN